MTKQATSRKIRGSICNRYRDAVLAFMKKVYEEIAADLCELVRIPATNPYSGDPHPTGEAAGQEFLEQRLRQIGCQTRRIPVPQDIYQRAGILGPQERSWTGRENLVAEYEFGSNGPVILLNAHADTVGVSDYEGDPFSGKREGDVVHGRGASDCKCGMLTGLYAIRALLESAIPLRGRVVFESVVDEECNGSGAGTLACCLEGVRGDYCLVLDGVASRLYTGCQGVTTVEISVRGRAAHGSWGGVSAVEKLLVTKRALDRLARERARRHPECLVNVGVLRAGVAPWNVPDRGWLAANINYAYEEAARAEATGMGFCGAAVRRRFEQIIARVTQRDEWLRENPPMVRWVKDLPPFKMADAGKPKECRSLLMAAKTGCSLAWGKRPRVVELHAWADASHLARIGRMPVVGMGAGEPGMSHTATEWNRVSNVGRTAAAVALTIVQLMAEPTRTCT
ncbi:MAG: M20 family metallopeptidase [Kiritimatiellae bacterium]|nr:M20 family metallopeptidase [Kiritimatiellia bacterium]